MRESRLLVESGEEAADGIADQVTQCEGWALRLPQRGQGVVILSSRVNEKRVSGMITQNALTCTGHNSSYVSRALPRNVISRFSTAAWSLSSHSQMVSEDQLALAKSSTALRSRALLRSNFGSQ